MKNKKYNSNSFEQYLSQLNKVNPMRFKNKSEFYYKNADKIMEKDSNIKLNQVKRLKILHPDKRGKNYKVLFKLDSNETTHSFSLTEGISKGNRYKDMKLINNTTAGDDYYHTLSSPRGLLHQNNPKFAKKDSKVYSSIVLRNIQLEPNPDKKKQEAEAKLKSKSNLNVRRVTRTFTNPNLLFTLQYLKQEASNDNKENKFIQELQKTQFKYILNHRKKLIAKKSRINFNSFNDVMEDYFLTHRHKNYFEIGIPSTKSDPFLEKMRKLEDLQQDLPDCRKSIDKIKHITTELERRKIIRSNEIKDIDERLGTLLQRFNPRDPLLTINTMSSHDKKDNSADSKESQYKFSNSTQRIKRSVRIIKSNLKTESPSLNKMQKEVRIIDNNETPEQSRRYAEDLSVPKNFRIGKNGLTNKFYSGVLMNCTQIENRNIKIMRKINSIKK